MALLTGDDIAGFAADAEGLREELAALAAFTAVSRSGVVSHDVWRAFVEGRVLPSYQSANGRVATEHGAVDAAAATLRDRHEGLSKAAGEPGPDEGQAKAAGWQVHHDREGFYAVGPAEEHVDGYGPGGDNLGFDGRGHFATSDLAWTDADRLAREGVDTNAVAAPAP